MHLLGRYRGCRHGGSRKCLCGVCCILTGVLLLVCFVPGWFWALVLAAACFAVGISLLCGRR